MKAALKRMLVYEYRQSSEETTYTSMNQGLTGWCISTSHCLKVGCTAVASVMRKLPGEDQPLPSGCPDQKGA